MRPSGRLWERDALTVPNPTIAAVEAAKAMPLGGTSTVRDAGRGSQTRASVCNPGGADSLHERIAV